MAKKAAKLTDERINPRELKEHGVKYVLDKIRRSKGYFMTNTERDLSQSDFKNRVMPHTQMLVAGERNACGYFSIEISGGASIHVDMLRKQINPFEKLRVLKSMMPDTLFQTLVPGDQPLRVPALSGKRHPAHGEALRGSDRCVPRLRLSQLCSEHGPRLRGGEEGRPDPGAVHLFLHGARAHRCLLREEGGGDHRRDRRRTSSSASRTTAASGTQKRIGDLVKAILDRFPDLILHYHGHNTDGNDIGRTVEAVRNGAKIVERRRPLLHGVLRTAAAPDDRRDPRGLRLPLRRDRQAGRHRHLEQAAARARILQGLRVPVPGLRPHRADPQAARAGPPARASSRPSRGTSSTSCRRSCSRSFRRSRSSWATGGA